MSDSTFTGALSPPERRTLADEVIDRLREAIWRGQLEPGEILREAHLAETLGVSRGPIRQALAQLEREELIIKHRNKSALVARLSRTDLEEVYSLRQALEGLAVGQATINATDQHISAMQEVIDKLASTINLGITAREAADLDIQFHEIMYQAANHRRLYEFWANLRPQILIFLLSRNVAHPDFRKHAAQQHQDILDVIRARDAVRAVQLIEGHLQLAYEQLLGSYGSKASAEEC